MQRLHANTELIIVTIVLMGLCACGGPPDEAIQGLPEGTAGQVQNQPDPVLEAELRDLLLQELERMGKDPERSASVPPAGNGNAVFWLASDALPPDGQGEAGSSSLQFYPRLVGDYDGNGEVGISDITPLGIYFGQSVEYDDAELHGGIAYWPSGDPDAAGRDNWLKARVDGDGNGIINVADITPIAVHFQEHADGWLVEQRFSSDGEYSLLPHSDNAELPFSIRWTELAPDSFGYLLTNEWPATGYLELRVQAYEVASESGGPFSSSVIYELGETDCIAALQASPTSGDFPLDVMFTAVGSSVVADSYDLVFGDGGFVTLTSLAQFPIAHKYSVGGVHEVELTVTCGTQQATDNLQITATPLVCELQVQLNAMPLIGFAPLNVLFDPVGTSVEAESYTLDFGDGSSPVSGTSLAQMAVQHIYDTSGEFTATLSAFCSDGGTAQATLPVSVGNTSDDCSVNLRIDNDHLLLGTDAAFFFAETTGSAGLIDFGDGSEPLFLNLQGPEPLLYEYTQTGVFLAVLSIQCDGGPHSDSVLVFVQPLPGQTFNLEGGLFQYVSNPPLGGPEPDKNPMVGAEVVIRELGNTAVIATVVTDASGGYFFDGESIGLDVSNIYEVSPSDAELAKWAPLEWLPGKLFIVPPPAETTKTVADMNLLAT